MSFQLLVVLLLTGLVDSRWTLPKRRSGDDGVACPPLDDDDPPSSNSNSTTITLLPLDRSSLKNVRLEEVTSGSEYYLNHKNPSSCVRHPKDSQHPMHDRAICPFRYKLNFDSLRIPKAITEVECQCPSVEVRIADGRQTFSCQNLLFEFQVVQRRPFPAGCDEPPPLIRTQQVSLACVAVVNQPAVLAIGRQTEESAEVDFEY